MNQKEKVTPQVAEKATASSPEILEENPIVLFAKKTKPQSKSQVSSNKTSVSTNKRKMLPRDLICNYFSPNGLLQLTGEATEKFNLLIIRELLDNSLDCCEERYQDENHKKKEIPDINIELQIQMTLKGFVKITVKDNGSGFDKDDIDKITDLTHFYSSRLLYKYPTRGVIGHAWKLILGIVHTLSTQCHAVYDEAPITIISKGKRYDINVEYDGKTPHAYPKVSDRKDNDGWSSKVSITLPQFNFEWVIDDSYLELVDKYACYSPHVNISYEGFNKAKSYLKVGESKLAFRESAADFDEDTWNSRLCVEERHTVEFVRDFRYFSDCAPDVCKGFHSETSDFSLEERKKLHYKMLEQMKKTNRKATETLLVPLALGKHYLFERLDEIFPSNYPKVKWSSGYKSIPNHATENHQEIPYLVEVAVVLNGLNKRCVYFGINRSPKISDDKSLQYGYWNIVKNKTFSGISEILKENDVTETDPVSVVIHLICPNIPYMDPGKTKIELRGFAHSIAVAVYNASRFYKGLKRKMDLANKDATGNYYIAHGKMTKKRATFQLLPEAVEFVSSNGKYRYYVRNLWYTLRDMFDKRKWGSIFPKYDYFTPKLTELFRKKYPNGEEILKGMLKEASAEMQEPHSDSITLIATESVEDYKLPHWKYNKVLVIEKRGFKGIITENKFQDKFDVAVVAGRGEKLGRSNRNKDDGCGREK